MNINKALQSAFEQYKTGNFEQAEHLCREILKIEPNNAEAYYYLGRTLQTKGQLDEALACYQKAVELNQNFAAAYNSLGNIFQTKGHLDESLACYQKAIELNPKVAVAYNNLGNVLQQKGQFDEAILYYQKALKLDPNLDIAYKNLARAYYSFGYIHREKGQFEDAINYYQKALQVNPNFSDAYYNLGIIYQEKDQLDEALTCYQEVINREPMHADARNAIGSILQKKGQIDEAMAYYRKALQINPNIPEGYNNLGTILREKGQIDEAVTHYRKALQINPNFPAAMNNLGTILREKGQIDEAMTCYRKAIELNSDFIEAHWNVAFTHLLSGNFRQGWQEYEWRWKFQDHYLHNLTQPIWDGSDITGRTILLHAEQGLGDTIQFIRYAPLVAELGAQVIVACQKELARLLQTVENIEKVVAYGNSFPEFDLHCPLLRLPLVFDTTLETIPATTPYISANPLLVMSWKEKIKHENSQFKIGLVWSGRPSHINNRNRSCSLEIFLPLTGLDGVTFYSLQKGEAAKQVKYPPNGMKLIDYSDEINDFSDTAAFIENLDLVISVDTAVAHLAGALGKPVWTLIPFAPDWRWLLNRDDSPWYHTMRLFRQPSIGDWESVISKVLVELPKKITGHDQ